MATKKCTTLAGWSGQSGLVDGSFEHAQFSEPGGLCLDPTGKTLFVADTNNHVIRVLDLDQKTVRQVWEHKNWCICYSVVYFYIHIVSHEGIPVT